MSSKDVAIRDCLKGRVMRSLRVVIVLGVCLGCSQVSTPTGTDKEFSQLHSGTIVYTYDPQQALKLEQKSPSADHDSSVGKEGDSGQMEPIDADYLIPAEDGPAKASDIAQVLEELDALRRDIARLDQNVNMIMRMRVSQLQEENRNLRRELQRLYTTGTRGGALEPPQVPAPGKELFEELQATSEETISPELKTQTQTEATLPPISAVVTPQGSPLSYQVVKEWGRTPQEAASLNASSLKGMVCVVPKGSSEDALSLLGKSLRQRFEEYDNITIDVFDDLDAANAYLNANASPGEHRVLTVSRHRGTQHDAVVLFRGGVAVPVAP